MHLYSNLRSFLSFVLLQICSFTYSFFLMPWIYLILHHSSTLGNSNNHKVLSIAIYLKTKEEKNHRSYFIKKDRYIDNAWDGLIPKNRINIPKNAN